jgi:hypothetical protein
MNRPFWINALVFGGLVALGAGSRLVDAAPNFAAVAAVALFAGVFFRSRVVAVAAPVCAMLLADSVIGWYNPRIMLAVYACLSLPVLMRGLINVDGRPAMWRALGGAGICSLAFFVFTNLAEWAFGTMYSHDEAGLVRCFEMALPFFRYTLASDVAFSVVLFGGYLLATRERTEAARLAAA